MAPDTHKFLVTFSTDPNETTKLLANGQLCFPLFNFWLQSQCRQRRVPHTDRNQK